jgi:hypothetical protein
LKNAAQSCFLAGRSPRNVSLESRKTPVSQTLPPGAIASIENAELRPPTSAAFAMSQNQWVLQRKLSSIAPCLRATSCELGIEDLSRHSERYCTATATVLWMCRLRERPLQSLRRRAVVNTPSKLPSMTGASLASGFRMHRAAEASLSRHRASAWVGTHG